MADKEDGSEACWQLSPRTFLKYLEEGRVRLSPKRKNTGRWGLSFLTQGDMRAIDTGELVIEGRDERGALIVKNSEEVDRRIRDKTMWTNDAYNARENGSKLLSSFLPGRQFPFPKSLYLVEDALRFYVGGNPHAIVLDFFAGSGTTAHAVMRLNQDDGGSRTSISVTNNEVSAQEADRLRSAGHIPSDEAWESKGIFEFVTKPRIRAAVTGVTPENKPVEGAYRYRIEEPFSQGFEENVEFFELTYEDKDTIKLGAAFQAIAPLLWLATGAEGPRVETIDQNWALPAGSRYGVLFNVDAWPGFVEAVLSSDSVTHAFVVTDSEGVFQRIASELPPQIEPVRLYESYLASFAINSGWEA